METWRGVQNNAMGKGKKYPRWRWVSVLLVSLFFLQGCSTLVSNRPSFHVVIDHQEQAVPGREGHNTVEDIAIINDPDRSSSFLTHEAALVGFRFELSY